LIYKIKSFQKDYKPIYFLIIYLIYLVGITLRPFEFSVLRYKTYISYSFTKILALMLQLKISDFFLNIILFIPLGILLFFLLEQHIQNRKTKIFLILIISLLLSSSIEFIQMFTDRFTSLWDVISNMTGALTGFTLTNKVILRHKIKTAIFRFGEKRIFRLSLLFIYILFLLILLLYPYHINTLYNWDTTYPLLLGNEATLNRHWEGKIFTVALYNQRLSAEEINKLFKKGYKNDSPRLGKEPNLILLYNFKENSGSIIHDVTNTKKPLNLKSVNTKWIYSQGISIDSTSWIKSLGSTKDIVDLLKSTSEMSIEIWCRTLDLNKTGPARIISLSISPDKRNFTLAQNKKDIHFRVRTPVTGINGSRINLIAPDIIKDKKIHHIIAVFDHGLERVFLDGKPAPGLIRADIDYLPFLWGLGKTHFSIIYFCLLFFLPLGFLLYYSISKHYLLISLVIVIMIISCSQYFYYSMTGQPFGLILYLYGVIFSLMGGLPRFIF